MDGAESNNHGSEMDKSVSEACVCWYRIDSEILCIILLITSWTHLGILIAIPYKILTSLGLRYLFSSASIIEHWL